MEEMENTLPPPTISFTIPSLHDATVLSCRVYHPDSLSIHALGRGGEEHEWKGQMAVFAHPYGPLGGSADDRVVDFVAGTLVGRGYLVGTFNFRGAGDSEGRTSWTAKGEKNDYISAAAFMLYYAHHLAPAPPREPPPFIMGGYSYGAMITTLLPPLPTLLAPFETPELGSAAAEVRLRAEHLADIERGVLARARAALEERGGASPRRSGIRVGGTESGEVRRSGDGRRSFMGGTEERIRRSIGDVVGRRRRREGGAEEGREGKEVEGMRRLESAGLVVPKVAYLLVSPLQGVITHLATMSFLPSKFSLSFRTPSRHNESRETNLPDERWAEMSPEDLKLTENPTLAIFGDRDGFVPASRLRAWASSMQGVRGSRFHAVEVSTGGHFWIEEGVLGKLVGAVKGFSGGLLWEGDRA